MGNDRSVTAWLASALLALGCGGTTSSGLLGKDGTGASAACYAGRERCSCYGNDTCNTGLTCASGLCVRLSKSGGRADAGTEGAAGGSPSTPEAGGAGTGARPGAGGAPGTGGRRATGGAAPGSGAEPDSGGAPEGGTVGAGGSAPLGGTSGAGGRPGSGGSSGTGGTCPSGEKFCMGGCKLPAPLVGCGLTGCEACNMTAPVNGYVTCSVTNQCTFDCLSGYRKSGDKCVYPTAADGGGNVDNCKLSNCPSCPVTLGPACCTKDAKCGCPEIPWVATTCVAQ